MSRREGLELSAKNTLAYISETTDHDSKDDWDSNMAAKIRTLSTNRSIRINRSKNRHTKSYLRVSSTANQSRQRIKLQKPMTATLSHRRTLVPRKVSVDNQILAAQSQNEQIYTFNKIAAKYMNKSKESKEKQNAKPFKSLRNYFSSMKKQQPAQKSQLNIDFMQFWVKNRFQQGSVNALVNKLKNKQNTSIRW